ncbi:MAG TPA: hypothetical protein VG675_00420 [Bryobacteraceae bacterium]|nr:hypothetical protein [Bryobacteraceae bacterium]
MRIHFRLAGGQECVINEHGVAQVPALREIPDFNLEEQLAGVSEFVLEPAIAADPKKPVKPQSVRREQLAAMASSSPAAAVEHEEE